MLSLERSRSAGRAGWIALVGVLVVPLLVAGGFLWATWKSTDRLHTVQAAVVNLDKPITVNGQLVPLGRQLSGGLVDGDDGQDSQNKAGDDDKTDPAKNFTWVLSTTDDARDGLASGKYAAVVTIPKSFSADATSYSANKADKARQATLDVQTSTIAGVTDPAVAQAISAAAVSALNKQLTQEYLKNIYVGFNTTGKQFTTVANGAKDLSDGVAGLSTGIGKTSEGTGKLADGLGQLSTGAGQLSDGLGQLAKGTKQLPGQTRQLADGIGDAADGTKQLSTGAAKLATGSKQLAAGTKLNATGVKTYADGAQTYADGVATYAEGVKTFDTGIQQSYTQLKKQIPGQVQQVCSAAGLEPDGPQCGAFVAAFPQILKGIYEGTPAQQGQPANPGLLKAAAGLDAGSAQLSTGAAKLAGGASQLSTGATKINTGAQGIATGVGGLSTGSAKLAGGLGQLADGTDKLADGLTKINTGLGGLAGGAAKLATGTSQSADGAAQLYQGTIQLDDGGDKLADGAKKLSDGLAKGAKQIPSYSASDRSTLSSVVAAPVASERPDSLFSDQTTTTLLAALALWLGGLVTYLVVRAVSAGAVGSMKSSARLALEGLAPGLVIGAVQSVALAFVLWGVLDLNAGQLARLLPLALFAGVTFAVVNHALVAWFGGVGRFVSVAILVLSAAGAVTTALPAFFGDIRPLLPVTPALDGMRAVIIDGPGIGHAVGLLLAWLVVGAVASVVAVARRRMLPVGALAPSTA